MHKRAKTKELIDLEAPSFSFSFSPPYGSNNNTTLPDDPSFNLSPVPSFASLLSTYINTTITSTSTSPLPLLSSSPIPTLSHLVSWNDEKLNLLASGSQLLALFPSHSHSTRITFTSSNSMNIECHHCSSCDSLAYGCKCALAALHQLYTVCSLCLSPLSLSLLTHSFSTLFPHSTLTPSSHSLLSIHSHSLSLSFSFTIVNK